MTIADVIAKLQALDPETEIWEWLDDRAGDGEARPINFLNFTTNEIHKIKVQIGRKPEHIRTMWSSWGADDDPEETKTVLMW